MDLRKENEHSRMRYDDSEWTDDDMRLLLANSAEGNGWNEAGMDAYDRYDEELGNQCLSDCRR